MGHNPLGLPSGGEPQTSTLKQNLSGVQMAQLVRSFFGVGAPSAFCAWVGVGVRVRACGCVCVHVHMYALLVI